VGRSTVQKRRMRRRLRSSDGGAAETAENRHGPETWGSHARASSGGASRRSGVRRRNGIFCGVFGCGGGGGGASATAKAKELGGAMTRSQTKQREGRPRLSPVMAEPANCVRSRFRYLGEIVGLVNSAREENRARAVAEINLDSGVISTCLHPPDTIKTKIENRYL